jgi:hypothetical protein
MVKYNHSESPLFISGCGDAVSMRKKKKKEKHKVNYALFYLRSRELIHKDLTFVCSLCLMNLHNHHGLIQSLPKKKGNRKNQPQKKKINKLTHNIRTPAGSRVLFLFFLLHEFVGVSYKGEAGLKFYII